jgi:putative mycofactocin binding protein MftB
VGDNTISNLTTLDNDLRGAMYSRDFAKARWLIEKGANPNTKNGWGSPLIYWCAECAKTDLIDFALEKGADIDATNKNGETALHRVAQLGRVDMIDFLVDRGANVNHRNIYDTTPLFVAALFDQPEATEKLLYRGADHSILNHQGISPAQIAKEKGNDAVVALLSRRMVSMESFKVMGLSSGVQVRREKFGLLFYDYRGPRLHFVPSGDLLDASLFDGTRTIGELVETLHSKHKWSRQWIMKKLDQILQQLEGKGLIHGQSVC